MLMHLLISVHGVVLQNMEAANAVEVTQLLDLFISKAFGTLKNPVD